MIDLSEPADRLLVDESPLAPGPGVRVLVVDSPELAGFALTAGAVVHAFCDDASAHDALPEGVQRNTPATPLPPLDLVWLRLPRDLDALDELAAWAASAGAPLLVGAGRTKHMTPTMNAVLARHFDHVEASRGRDKSRALRARDPRVGGNRPWPRWRELAIGPRTLRVAHHGGTFASGRLDPATRLLLEQTPTMVAETPRRVLDWGAGAGIIAAHLTAHLASRPAGAGHVAPDVTAVDLSWAGWAASSASMATNELPVRCVWGDGNRLLADGEPYDLVVSNPPFHAGAAKSSQATLRMIDLAASRLAPGGSLWLTYNSHLPWLTHMRRHGRADIIAQNRGYTVARLRVR